ncbi:MAG: hypothetical protein V2J42_13460 [Wenzhouxiangella sp.]|nr:hypothetical protein [Wenzhouxiangella sp.]
MRRIFVFLWLGLLAGCGTVNEPINVEPGGVVEGDLRSVNGAVTIGDGARVSGSLSNVNGPIDIGERASVGAITSVNGRITLQAGADAGQVESVNGAITLASEVAIGGDVTAVNGSIEVGESSRIDGDVTTVNGSVALSPNAQVQGKVANVRGKIRLDGALVDQIETTAGSIELTGTTTVEGQLWVKAPRNDSSDVPRIVIGPEVTVGGPLQFDREVELLIHDNATVGEIIGAEPECFSCEITDL